MVREMGSDLELIVSDIHMPNGDGLVFAHAVKASFPGMPIVMMSGCAEPDPGFAFLQKPFLPGALLETVRRLVPLGE
jgi:DNA-binding NtrC family response regulator